MTKNGTVIRVTMITFTIRTTKRTGAVNTTTKSTTAVNGQNMTPIKLTGMKLPGKMTNTITGFKQAAVLANHQRKTKVRTNHPRMMRVRTNHPRMMRVRTNHPRMTKVRTSHQKKMKKSTGTSTGSTGRKNKRMETSMLGTSTKTVTTFLIWSSSFHLLMDKICTQPLFQKATSIFNVGRVNLTLMTTQIISMMSLISVENSKERRKKKTTNHSSANTKIKLFSKKKK